MFIENNVNFATFRCKTTKFFLTVDANLSIELGQVPEHFDFQNGKILFKKSAKHCEFQPK